MPAPLLADPRDPEELDQTVVRAEAGRPAHLQDAQGGPVGGHSPPALLRAHRAAFQEGRLLLQALPPTRPVCLGCEGPQRRERGLHHTAPPQQLPDLQGCLRVGW